MIHAYSSVDRFFGRLCRLCLLCLPVLLLPLAASAGPRVFVTNYPLKYFTQRIAASSVEVVLPVPAGMDPSQWMPDTATIQAMQQARLILVNGAGYEPWLPLVALPKSRLVNTSSSFRDQYIRVSDQMTHQHGPQGKHSHATLRHTTWLDLQLAASQARAIVGALTKLFPQQAGQYAANGKALVDDLETLDRKFAALFSPGAELPLLASPPVYDYLARRYGLNLTSLLWLPQTMASREQWQAFEQLHRQHPAQWILWAAPPLDAIRARLEQAGVSTVVFEPCASEPQHGDFLTVMEDNYRKLRLVFPDKP